METSPHTRRHDVPPPLRPDRTTHFLLAVIAIGIWAVVAQNAGRAPSAWPGRVTDSAGTDTVVTNTVIGMWEPAGSGGSASRTNFYADGAAQIVTPSPTGPAETYDARYTVSGDTLTISDVQGAESFLVGVTPDTLVLDNPATGVRTVLVRVHD